MSKKEQLKQKFEDAFDDVEKREDAAKALTVQGDNAIAAWGDRNKVIATGIRIKTMLPGGDKLSVIHALAAGQYAVATGLNPFRGEFYPMVDRDGNLHLIDGYKALTRWAEDECPFDVQYRNVELGPGEAHHIECIIMRHDRREQLDYYLERGAPFETAFDLVTTKAVGVVKEIETKYRDGNPKNPPTGWTWEQRAKIRALKNALNLSHGMPTMDELARKSWEVRGTMTQEEDWEGTEDLQTDHERERLAEMRALDRKRQEEWESLTKEEQQAQFQGNVTKLRGDFDEDDPFGIDGEDVVDGEGTISMTLEEALACKLHKPAPKLGLEAGQTLEEVLELGTKCIDLLEYLTKASAYDALTDEAERLQEAAQIVLGEYFEDRKEEIDKEDVPPM